LTVPCIGALNRILSSGQFVISNKAITR